MQNRQLKERIEIGKLPHHERCQETEKPILIIFYQKHKNLETVTGKTVKIILTIESGR